MSKLELVQVQIVLETENTNESENYYYATNCRKDIHSDAKKKKNCLLEPSA